MITPTWDIKYSKEDIVELYKSGMSIDKVANIVKASSKTAIRTIVSKSGIKVRTNKDYKKYYFDEDYFECINTEQKAYFLGLLYADGNVYQRGKRPVVQITLQNSDSSILEEMRKAVNYSGPFYSDRGKYTKLMLCSIKMTNDLIALGCIPRKSLVLKFPTEEQVPKHLLNHFIRGYFDGDGSVSNKSKNTYIANFTATEDFIDKLRSTLSGDGITLSKFYPRYKDKLNSCGSAWLYETTAHNPFYNYLYNNASIWMSRKKNKMDIHYA